MLTACLSSAGAEESDAVARVSRSSTASTGHKVGHKWASGLCLEVCSKMAIEMKSSKDFSPNHGWHLCNLSLSLLYLLWLKAG